MGNAQANSADNIVITRRGDTSSSPTSTPSSPSTPSPSTLPSPATPTSSTSTSPVLSASQQKPSNHDIHPPLSPPRAHAPRTTASESTDRPPPQAHSSPNDTTRSFSVGVSDRVPPTEQSLAGQAPVGTGPGSGSRTAIATATGKGTTEASIEAHTRPELEGTRTRGMTFAGLSAPIVTQLDGLARLGGKLTSAAHGIGGKAEGKKQKLDKATKERIAAALNSSIKQDSINGTMKLDGTMRLDGTTKFELEDRRSNRSSSVGGDVASEARARHAAIILAALKRVSQKMERRRESTDVPKKPPILSPRDKAAIKIQTTFRRWIAVRKYKRQLQRTSVVREILITELDYVRYLSVLVKVYYYPLRKANIISNDEMMAIFPQVEIIKIYNTKFVEMLQKKLREWSCDQTIGDVFVSMVDFMKISETITACSRRLPVAHFLKKCTKFTEVASMDLLSLTSMPFQRIPRYMLLLKECLKFTEKDHKDYEFIRVAIKKLDSLTHAASERLRIEESIKAVVRVSALLNPPVAFKNLVRPYRKLLREGVIDVKFLPPFGKDKDHPQMKNCNIFLFNDCVLLAKPHKRPFFETGTDAKLQPVQVMDLRGAVLLDATGSDIEFRLRVQTGVLIFHTKNWPEKEAWRSDVMDAIILLREEDATPSGGSMHSTNTLSNNMSSPLGRSMSMQLDTPAHEKLPRTRSQFYSTPQESALQPNQKPAAPTQDPKVQQARVAQGSSRQPRKLTRQFTLPQIGLGDLFANPSKLPTQKPNQSSLKLPTARPRKLSAPKVTQQKQRAMIGTTTRKINKEASILAKSQEMRKSRSTSFVRTSTQPLRSSMFLPSL